MVLNTSLHCAHEIATMHIDNEKAIKFGCRENDFTQNCHSKTQKVRCNTYIFLHDQIVLYRWLLSPSSVPMCAVSILSDLLSGFLVDPWRLWIGCGRRLLPRDLHRGFSLNLVHQADDRQATTANPIAPALFTRSCQVCRRGIRVMVCKEENVDSWRSEVYENADVRRFIRAYHSHCPSELSVLALERMRRVSIRGECVRGCSQS